MTTITDEHRKAARDILRQLFPHGSPMAQADLAEKFAHLLATRDEMARGKWRPIAEVRPNRDGFPNYTDIIYLARDPKPLRNPYYGGFAVWHAADEGLDEGWWDYSMTQYVEPIGFMPLPDPKEANFG